MVGNDCECENSDYNSSIIDKKQKFLVKQKLGLFVVGPDVKLSANVELVSQCIPEGNTTIGQGTKIFSFAALELGLRFKIQRRKNSLFDWKSNLIRICTINPGTEELTKTIVGNNCLFMISSHIAHDCKIGNNVIIVITFP